MVKSIEKFGSKIERKELVKMQLAAKVKKESPEVYREKIFWNRHFPPARENGLSVRQV